MDQEKAYQSQDISTRSNWTAAEHSGP